jgi:imidazolonepropionase-like amidohydrolase
VQVACLLAVVVSAAAGSSSLGATGRQDASGTIAIVNGTLIDGTGSKPVANATVVIRSGRIVAAGRRGTVRIPKGAKRLDARGGTILPGFINTHIHGGLSESTLEAFAQGGVTTVRDLASGADYERAFAYRDRMLKQPRLARLVAVGPMVTVEGGYPIAIWGDSALTVSSPDDARAKVTKLIEAGADVVKIALESGAVFSKNGLPELSTAEVKAIVETAHAHGRRVTVHAMVAADVERALDGGVDEIAHMAVDSVSDNAIKRMVENHVAWVPTLEVIRGVGLPDGGTNLRRFIRAGGTVALGSDYGAPNVDFDLGMPVHEVQFMRQTGMTPMQIIVAATKNAAYACGLGKTLGTLKPGMIADVIVVQGNPLKNLSTLGHVTTVVHTGILIHASKTP